MVFIINIFVKDMNKCVNISNFYFNGNVLGWFDFEVVMNVVGKYFLFNCF